MLKKLLLGVMSILVGCNSAQKEGRSPHPSFCDEYLLFDREKEEERIPCKIQGEIPLWLSGTLLRNGPAKFAVEGKRVDWFDGLAMLHAFEFNAEQVLYTNRFIRSEQYYKMMVEKSLNFSGFSQDPCPKIFKNKVSKFIPQEMQHIQNANVSIQEYADKMVALTEAPLPVLFDSETLATLGEFQYQDKISQGQWESAHPQYDPISLETVNYFIRFGKNSTYTIWKMKEHSDKREVIAEIPVDNPSYMHSFALTEHYVVLVEFPFVVNPLSLLLSKKPFIFNYKWHPERGTRFTVVERSTGKVVSEIKGAPFFAFHHVNAFDQDGKICMDIVTYPNADIIKELTNELKEKNAIGESEKTKLERFTITLATQELKRETIYASMIELPRISSSLTAHPYKYCYAIDTRFPTSTEDKPPLYKIDVATGIAKSWSEAGCFPGEPIFVPRPDGKDEDDGVVLSLVLDFAHHRSFLLLLNAKDFTEAARADVPHAIPVGLHGLWHSKS